MTDRTLQSFGAIGDGVTNDFAAIQDAFNYGVENNVTIYDKIGGTYLIGNDAEGLPGTVMINHTKPNQNFKFIGAGKGVTIFKEPNNKVVSRYSKMFYFYLNKLFDFGNFSFSDCTLDKNGSNREQIPETPYEFEQAHCFGISQHLNSTTNINTINFSNIEIKDKIGAGINASAKNAIIGSVTVDNINSVGFSKLYGQRGDVELSLFSEVTMSDLDIEYCQIEIMDGWEGSVNKQRKTTINNSTVNILEFTTVEADMDFNSLIINNVICDKKLLVRGVSLLATNCNLNLSEPVYSKDANFNICNIKVNCTIDGNITPIYIWNRLNHGQNINFNECNFIVDTVLAEPSGFLFFAQSKTFENNIVNVIIDNCTFDARLEALINSYASNTYRILNSNIECRSIPFKTGGYDNYCGALLLHNNNYQSVISDKLVHVVNNNRLWKLTSFDGLQISDISVVGDDLLVTDEMLEI